MSNNPYNRKKRKILLVFSVMKPFVSYTKGKKNYHTNMREIIFERQHGSNTGSATKTLSESSALNFSFHLLG